MRRSRGRETRWSSRFEQIVAVVAITQVRIDVVELENCSGEGFSVSGEQPEVSRSLVSGGTLQQASSEAEARKGIRFIFLSSRLYALVGDDIWIHGDVTKAPEEFSLLRNAVGGLEPSTHRLRTQIDWGSRCNKAGPASAGVGSFAASVKT